MAYMGDFRDFVGYVGATLTLCADTLDARFLDLAAPVLDDSDRLYATALRRGLRDTADVCLRILDRRPSDPPPPSPPPTKR